MSRAKIRIRRSVRIETRLAVIVATAPLAKRSRALAMSSNGAGDRRADRVDRFDRTVDQRQDQIEIVDHQIEDHRHIGAARLERGDAHRLDIQRHPACAPTERDRRRRTAPDDRPAAPARSPAQISASSSACASSAAIGFSTSTCLPARKAVGRELEMRLRRSGDDQRVDRGQQRLERHVGRAGFPADGFRPLGIGIVNPDQLRAIRRGDLQRVVAAEMTGTGDADAKRRRDGRDMRNSTMFGASYPKPDPGDRRGYREAARTSCLNGWL